jgi:hypothetical protein
MDALGYAAGLMLIAWGVMHLVPTREVADSFAAISLANRRILVMEWIAEGLTHAAVGGLVILVAALEGAFGSTAQLVYRVLAAFLVVLACMTALTGSRTPVVWFKICPFVLTSAAALLLVSSLL